jgi:hypothetical protein
MPIVAHVRFSRGAATPGGRRSRTIDAWLCPHAPFERAPALRAPVLRPPVAVVVAPGAPTHPYPRPLSPVGTTG